MSGDVYHSYGGVVEALHIVKRIEVQERIGEPLKVDGSGCAGKTGEQKGDERGVGMWRAGDEEKEVG